MVQLGVQLGHFGNIAQHGGQGPVFHAGQQAQVSGAQVLRGLARALQALGAQIAAAPLEQRQAHRETKGL